jgi:hypothetical protein
LLATAQGEIALRGQLGVAEWLSVTGAKINHTADLFLWSGAVNKDPAASQELS